MPQFETNVQELKYKVLKEVAKSYYAGNLQKDFYKIPKIVVPGPKPTMRCCIYHERAIVEERIRLAMGGDPEVDNVIEVIKIACDECPLGGYEVTNRCRGCIAHRCEKACHRNAIHFDARTRAAYIDKDLCVNCGMCAKACQYGAIQNNIRPCVQACKVKAIKMDEDDAALIDDVKCVQCGACVSQCPFGAIMDKSFMLQAIDLLRAPEHDAENPVYAIVAPAIASQFHDVTLGKVVSGIKALGFDEVYEAASGADMVADNEAKELAEKGFLTSSCCPTFASYIKKNYPQLKDNISHNLSPMATIAKWLKEHNPSCKIAFIGPCIAKKKEIQDPRVAPYVDVVLTFEELQALFDAREIDLSSLGDEELKHASYFGRVFGRAGGLCEAVKQALAEQGSSFELKPYAADGLDNCRTALIKAKSPTRDFNFIEGMGCVGGCIGGPCALEHEFRNKGDVDKYGKDAKEPTISSAISSLNSK